MAKGQDTLRELVSQYKELRSMAADPENDIEAILGSIEGIEGELEIKMNGIGIVHGDMKLEEAAQKARIAYAKEVLKGMQDHLKALENNRKRLEDYLLGSLITLGLDETGVKTEMYEIKVQGIGGVQELWTDKEKIPKEFMKTEVVVSPDNDKIREYVKDHDVDWARLLPRGKKVVIK